MRKRIVTGAVGLIVFGFVFMFWDTWVINVCISAIVAICIYELSKATGCIKNIPLFVVSEIFVIIMTYFYDMDRGISRMVLIFFVFALFAILLANHRNIGIGQVGMMFLFCVMIPYFLSPIMYLRDTQFGQFLVYLPFVAAWTTDTGAYFIGIKFGKHKLAPEVSPKKTIEGAFGGILGSVIGCSIYALVVMNSFRVQGVIWGNLILLAVILSIVDQFGDLSFSKIKREFETKDYGNFMPGHGGALDRFDGVIFVAPACFLLLKLIDIFIGAGI